MLLFYFFAAISIWLGVLSVRGGFRYFTYVRRESSRPLAGYAPLASVIAPFRGVDQGFEENITALFNQNYPAYELIFVTGRADDPAFVVIDELRNSVGISQ